MTEKLYNSDNIKQPIVLQFKNWTPFTFKNFVFFDTTDVMRFRLFKPKSLVGDISYKDILMDVVLSNVIIHKIRFQSINQKQMDSYIQMNHRAYPGMQYNTERLDTNPKPDQNQLTISEINRKTPIGNLFKITVSKILPFTTVTIMIYTKDNK